MTTRTLATHAGFIFRVDRARDAFVQWLLRTGQAIETRRQLAEMDDRMLQDIGISRADALVEAERSSWDLGPRCPARPSSLSRSARLRRWSREAIRRHRTRKHLAELDARALKDIGLTLSDAENEASKPFWRE
jgi:uncharacterized protein YjiS (DUF1127 family)